MLSVPEVSLPAAPSPDWLPFAHTGAVTRAVDNGYSHFLVPTYRSQVAAVRQGINLLS